MVELKALDDIYLDDLQYLQSYYKEYYIVKNYYRNSADLLNYLDVNTFYKNMTIFNNYYRYYDDNAIFVNNMNVEYYNACPLSKAIPLFHLSSSTLEDPSQVAFLFEEYCKEVRPKVQYIVRKFLIGDDSSKDIPF